MFRMMQDSKSRRLADMATFTSGMTNKKSVSSYIDPMDGLRLSYYALYYTYVLTTEDGILLVPALWSDVIKLDDVVILRFNNPWFNTWERRKQKELKAAAAEERKEEKRKEENRKEEKCSSRWTLGFK